jgi:hypothetical protein
MDISYNKKHLALSLGTTSSPAKEAVIPLSKPDGTGVHISAAVLFYLFEDRLEARLTLQDDGADQSVSLGIGAKRLNGECSISIGGMAASDGDGGSLQTPSDEQTRRRSERQKRPETAIWNEFAVLYMVPPEEPVLAELDIEEDEIDEDEDVEETAAVIAIPDAESEISKSEKEETETIIDEQEEGTEPRETETAARIGSETEEPSGTVS